MTDYASIDAVNWSSLAPLATSPRMFEWRRDHAREETSPLRLGTAIHCAILEPETWASRYVAKPDFGDLRTKAGKAARDEWLATVAPDVVILDADEHALAERCAASVRAHPAASSLLSHGRAEEIVTWTDAVTGIACKGRLDYLAFNRLVDLKSTRAQTLRDLAREIAGRLYHGQLAFYLDGAMAAGRLSDVSQVYVVAVQTVEPFDVIPARIMTGDLELGRALYRSLLRKYAACRAADYWPGLAPGVVDLPLPAWTPSGEPEQTGDEW